MSFFTESGTDTSAHVKRVSISYKHASIYAERETATNKRSGTSAFWGDLFHEVFDRHLINPLVPNDLCTNMQTPTSGWIHADIKKKDSSTLAACAKRTFAVLLHLVAPSALDEFVAQQLFQALFLAAFDQFLADALFHLLIATLPVRKRSARRREQKRALVIQTRAHMQTDRKTQQRVLRWSRICTHSSMSLGSRVKWFWLFVACALRATVTEVARS